MPVRETYELDTSQAEKALDEFEKEVTASAKRQTKAISKEARESGEEMAREMVKGFNRERRTQKGRLKEQFVSGMISKDELRKAEKQIDRTINQKALKAIKRLERQGKLTAESQAKLAGSLRKTAVRTREVGAAGEDAGDKISRGFNKARLAVAAVVTAVVGSGLVVFLRNAARAAVDVAKSYLELNASAKLFNVAQEDLVELSQQARSEYELTTRQANELAIVTTKLAARAEHAGEAQNLLARALDLGAAQGLTAEETTVALNQALLGLDEGTDKLLQKNPSQIYEEYAESIGKAAGKMTDAEQKQALLNAILVQGQKVTGAYDDMLQSDIGTLTTWQRLIQGSTERIGEALIPILANLADLLEGPVKRGTDIFIDFLDTIDRLTSSPLDNLIKDLKRAGTESQTLARAELALRRIQLMKERDRFRGERDIVRAPGIPGADVGRIGEARTIQAKSSSIRQLELTDVTLPALQDEVERVTDLIDEMASGEDAATQATSKRVERLADYQQRLLEVIQRRQRELEISQELKQVEEDLAIIRAGGTPPDRRGGDEGGGGITPEPLDLPEIEDQEIIGEIALSGPRELLGLMEELDPQFETINGKLALLADATRRAATAQRELTLARLEGDPEAIAAAEERVANAKAHVEERALALRDALEAAGLSEKKMAEVTEELIKRLKEAGVDMEGLDEAADEAKSSWEEWADVIEGVLRGIMNVLDAVGALDDQTRKALQGGIDLASGIGQIASGNVLGGTIQAVGGAANLVSGLMDDAQQARREEIRAMQDLERALRDVENAVLNTISTQERDALIRFLEHARSEQKQGVQIGAARGEALRKADLIEEVTGISLFDDSGIFFDPEAVKAALEALRSMDVGAFGETLFDRLDAFQFALGALGEDAGTAAERLQRFLDVLASIPDAAGFADELQKRIEKDGPEAAEAWLKGMAKTFAQPGGFEQLVETFPFLKGLSAEEFQRILEDALSFVGEVGAGGDRGTTRSVQIARTITEIQANEVVAWLQEIAFWVKDFATRYRAVHGLQATTLAVSSLISVNSGVGGAAQRSGSGGTDTGGPVTVNGPFHIQGPVTDEQFEQMMERLREVLWTEIQKKPF